jgi:hypothetical protein
VSAVGVAVDLGDAEVDHEHVFLVFFTPH